MPNELANLSNEAKPQTVLPHSWLLEIELAGSSSWNLNRAASQMGPQAMEILKAEQEHLIELLKPAHQKEIMAILGKLMLHYPMTNMTSHEKTMLLEDYILDISAYPASTIAETAREYRLNPENQFFPKIAQLTSTIGKKLWPLTKRLRTINSLLEMIPESRRIAAEKATAEDFEKLRQSLPQSEAPKPISMFIPNREHFEKPLTQTESCETAMA